MLIATLPIINFMENQASYVYNEITDVKHKLEFEHEYFGIFVFQIIVYVFPVLL